MEEPSLAAKFVPYQGWMADYILDPIAERLQPQETEDYQSLLRNFGKDTVVRQRST